MKQGFAGWLALTCTGRRPMEKQLDWSAKQGRILTGGGNAERLYTAARGFPFTDDELPHFHLMAGTTAVFRTWREQLRTCPALVGVWSRPLFIGGFEHSTGQDEVVYNTQTPSMFIDLRLPTTRPTLTGHTSLATLSDLELRCFARQHCFGGYSLGAGAGTVDDPVVVTRHHIVDW